MKELVILFGIITVVLAFMQYLDLIKKNREDKAKKMKEIEDNLIREKRYNKLYHKIVIAETLTDLFILHLQLWMCGIRNANLAPDKFGYFRTEEIETMTRDEVYLGGINGLFTNNISFLEEYNKDNVNTELEQYRHHLLSNMKAIKETWKD